MLQRTFLHLSLILLFAFTQIGVATHAISHLADSHEQQQQEQNSNEHQCGQCISLSHVADVMSTQALDFAITAGTHTLVAARLLNASTTTPFPYSARAPPPHSQT